MFDVSNANECADYFRNPIRFLNIPRIFVLVFRALAISTSV